MPRSRWETHIEPFLTEIAGWKMRGVPDEEVAENLGVAYSTFRRYIKQKPELEKVLMVTKDIADAKVEGSFFKRANGCVVREVTKEPYIDPITGHKAVDDEGNLRLRITKVIEKELPPDVGAGKWWLENRMPEIYKSKHEIAHSDADKIRKLEDLL